MNLASRLSLGAAFVVAVALRAVEIGSSGAVGRLVDDAFIDFDVARTLGTTGHLSTSGFQPLYVLLIAPIYAVFRPETVAQLDAAARASLAVCALADLVAMSLLVLLLYRTGGALAASIGAWVWAVHPGVLAFATNGLETSVSLACLLGVLVVAAEPRRPLALGAAIGLAMIARVDMAALGAAAALWTLLDARASGRVPWRDLARLAGGWSLVYLPWVAFLSWQTGDVLPISGPATAHMSRLEWLRFYEEGGNSYLLWVGGVAAAGLGFGAAAVGLASAALAPAAEGLGRFRLLWTHIALLTSFYVLFYGNWWYIGRYLAPWLVLEIVALALGAAAVARAGATWRQAITGAALVTAALAFPAYARSGWHVYTPPAGGALVRLTDYRGWALAVRERVSPDETYGAIESGALSYYLPGRIVNCDGVCNREAYLATRRDALGEYLLANGVRRVIGTKNHAHWIDIQSVSVHCEPDGDELWRIVPKTPGAG